VDCVVAAVGFVFDFFLFCSSVCDLLVIGRVTWSVCVSVSECLCVSLCVYVCACVCAWIGGCQCACFISECMYRLDVRVGCCTCVFLLYGWLCAFVVDVCCVCCMCCCGFCWVIEVWGLFVVWNVGGRVLCVCQIWVSERCVL